MTDVNVSCLPLYHHHQNKVLDLTVIFIYLPNLKMRDVIHLVSKYKTHWPVGMTQRRKKMLHINLHWRTIYWRYRSLLWQCRSAPFTLTSTSACPAALPHALLFALRERAAEQIRNLESRVGFKCGYAATNLVSLSLPSFLAFFQKSWIFVFLLITNASWRPSRKLQVQKVKPVLVGKRYNILHLSQFL